VAGRTPPLARYGAAVACVALATAARLLLDPLLGEGLPYITYFPAVALAAWYGGTGPSLLALALGALVADYLFIPPRGSLLPARAGDSLGLGLFLGLGAAIALVCRSLRGAQRRAEERGEWLRVTLASIGDAVIATDAAGRVALLNAAAEGLTGWTSDEAKGRPLADVFRIVHEQTRRPAEDPVARVLRDGVVVGLANHTALVARDGTERPIADSAAPIRDAAGAILGVVLVFRDVGASRAREEELRRNEERFRTLVAASSQAVWRAGADFTRNEVISGEDPIGLTDDQRRDGRWLDAVHPEDRERTRLAFEEAVRTRSPYEVEHRVRSRGGPYRTYLARAVPILDDAGRIREWIGTSTDVTEQRRAEREAREAREAAESANRAKDAFLAALSHELRTPLNPVLMAATALEADPRWPPDLRDELRMIRRNVELEARLIDDLLDLTRITQGKMSFHLEMVDAHAKIRHAVEICRGEARAKQLRLDLELRARRHRVRADAARLQQVVWNLVKNAVKFTPEGGSVTVRTEDAGADTLRITVADTGVGIEPDLLPRIFAAFEQGGPATTRRFGGLGLGLAISRAIVEAHGGTLSASSPGPGRGATFCVELGGATDPDAEAAAAAPAEEAGPARPLRVLLVEDHADTARVLARLLSRAGHEVTTASGVAAALERASAVPLDLLICDLGLPDGSGLEVMRRLRPLPGIALTGYGMEQDVRRAHEAGFLAHLTKPVDFAELDSAIRRVAAARPLPE
jgi:PAS domain S-box-containing protein